MSNANNPIGDGIAIVHSTVSITHTPKSGEPITREYMHNAQINVPIDALVTGGAPVASVTRGRTSRVSHAEFYGQGTWDKIPYTVETYASVTLQCDQTPEKITQAQNMADDICAASINRGMERALVESSMSIREKFYPDLFAGDE